MPCQTAERILPQVQTRLQAREGGTLQFALAQCEPARDPDVRDVLASRGIREMRRDVVAGRELRGAQRDRGEIRLLAGDDRADALAQAERASATERGRMQRL